MTGDCFYMYYDSTICNVDGDRCPLYIYVDGTENAEDIDERDSAYMVEMARRGYIAVTVDYDDMALNYIDGCDGFHEKSKKIFDGSIKGSVIHQLCYDDENDFGHRDMIPVDCELGVVVNGYSQGSHVASLAGNYAPTLVTAGLFWANGNYNTACAFEWPRCLFCADTDVSCMNSNSIILPREKRRNIVGAQDSFFGACENYFGADNRINVIDQIRAVSGYSCAYERDNCFRRNTNKAGYFVVDGKGHNFMDVRPWSDFMDEATVWGLPQNFDWLAEQGRVSPRSGICSTNSGSTAGDACTSNSDCQCNRRQLNASQSSTENVNFTLATNDSAHRGLKKDKEKGGDKNNPAAPTPPATSTPTNAPSPDFCGCVV